MFTKKLPDFIVVFISSLLNIVIQPYIFLCKFINLPIKGYFVNVFSKYSWKRRNQVIFDQLNFIQILHNYLINNNKFKLFKIII